MKRKVSPESEIHENQAKKITFSKSLSPGQNWKSKSMVKKKNRSIAALTIILSKQVSLANNYQLCVCYVRGLFLKRLREATTQLLSTEWCSLFRGRTPGSSGSSETRIVCL